MTWTQFHVLKSNFGLWRSLASALAWGARGPEFKSRQPDQIPQRLTDSRPSGSALLASKWSPKGTPHAFGVSTGRQFRYGFAPTQIVRFFDPDFPGPLFSL